MATALVLALVAASCGEGGGDSRVAASTVLAPSEGVARAQPAADAPVAELASGFNEAGFELLRTQPVGENLVFSPLSIGHALLMARAAADDPTAAAIDEALALPDGMSAHEAWNAIDSQIAAAADAEADVVVTIADRIWPDVGAEPDQAWIDLMASHHGADTEALDLQGDQEGSRQTINSWISDQTEGLIPELLGPGFVQPNTVLVLADAVYFKARWQRPFGKYGSIEDTFTRLDGTTTTVDFMQELELESPRGKGDGFVAAEIPYAGGELAMLVIVPDEGRFEDMRNNLDQDLLDTIDATLTTGSYELLLPEWEDASQIDLLAWLEGLGAAPGSYPLIDPGAFLDAAVHGADIAVDEWGTVAAAATAFGFEESGAEQPQLTIAADKPFLYVIRHVDSGVVLFAGQVTDPTA